MYELLALLGGFALLYSIFATRVERTWISGPILFVAFGFAVGRQGLGWLRLEAGNEAEALSVLAELTLALVLFTDAAGTNIRVLRRTEALPIRLLAIGLPLTILLGVGAGMAIFPELGLLEITLLATMLAPTDAALGKGVITNEAVPSPVRQGLNVESGLNDGICVPILYLFLELMRGSGNGGIPQGAGLRLFAEAVGIGLACGLLVTWIAVVLIRLAQRRDWLSPTWTKITVVALAFTSFGAAQALGGSGFIACFAGGLLLDRLQKPDHHMLLDAAEGLGDGFALITWTLFGAAIVGPALAALSLPILLYALCSLTVVRMLPVFLVLIGTTRSIESRLFIGWFGPRGLASIVFAVIVIDAHLPHGQTLTATVACTVLLSILLHGLTANPWAKGFGARSSGARPATPTGV